MLLLLVAARVHAEPGLSGHSGIIAMPDGRIAPDGSFGAGVSYTAPYTSAWTSLALAPWAEFTLRFARVSGVQGLAGSPEYGDYKDKSVGAKIRLLDETERLPSIAIGANDFVTDTQRGLFESRYLAVSKRIGDLDLTLGAGSGRIDGIFGGLRYSPSAHPTWSLVAEYDANDYPSDLFASDTGLDRRGKGVNLGVEYRWGWLATQLSYQRDRAGIDVRARVPLEQREFIPKLDEPPPYSRIAPRPSDRDWQQDPVHARRLLAALERQEFRNVRLRYAGRRLDIVLTNSRISSVPRAVGRAARTALLLAPRDARAILITYTLRDLELVSYEMFDLPTLQRYFAGEVGRKALAQTVAIRRAEPIDRDAVWDAGSASASVPAAHRSEAAPLRLATEPAPDRPRQPPAATPEPLRAAHADDMGTPRLRLDFTLDRQTPDDDPLPGGPREPAGRVETVALREREAGLADSTGLQVEPSLIRRFQGKDDLLDELEDSDAAVRFAYGEDGDIASVKSEDSLQNRFSVKPALGFYFNDPSGAFHYELSLVAGMEHRLAPGTYFGAAAALTLAEDVSDVTQPSNSLLPHVRSDVAEYKKGARAKIHRVLLNHFFQPAGRVFARASAGLYEEMFGGAGGQILYLPGSLGWGADLAVDWLRQRDYDGIGFLPYSTVTSIASLNYRLPYEMTATARAGRFLAGDNGVRLELKRRFRSGVEIGAWYSLTDARDVTSPGSEDSPYRDKGVFVSIPLASMLTRDTQAGAGISIAPWTRDVAQMVTSPADLYRMLERPLVHDVSRGDGLSRFGDLDDDYSMGGSGLTLFDRSILGEAVDDAGTLASAAASPGGLRAFGVGLGAVLASSALDRRIDEEVAKHSGNSFLRGLDRIGKAAPLIAAGAAGLASLSNDARLAGIGAAALKAGLAGALVGHAAKYPIGRARPDQGLGPHDFDPFGPDAGDSSFPSDHVAATWGAVAPFAREYDMPWLYGAALLSNAGRIAGRRHWLSDTVAGALLGYGIGLTLWDSERRRWGADQTRIDIRPDGIEVSARF